MTEHFFLLGDQAQQQRARDPFAPLGFASNPFPTSGAQSGVFYQGHLTTQLETINIWLSQTQRALNSADRDRQPVLQPLALRGSLGVGKTHFLRHLDRGLGPDGAGYTTARCNLTDRSSERLLLSGLLLVALRGIDVRAGASSRQREADAGEVSSVPLVDAIVDHVAFKPELGARLERTLKPESKVRAALKALVKVTDSDERTKRCAWFAQWLLRGHTSGSQRNKLGLGGTLKGEGDAILAFVDMLRAAWSLELIKGFFLMLDQLEELWREKVITPARRARFLTDLRLLVDQALEGAPMGIVLSWNTEIDDGAHLIQSQTSEHLQRDYMALWLRLQKRVDMPALARDQIWDFARAYLDAATTFGGDETARQKLIHRLEEAQPEVIKRLERDPNARLGDGLYPHRQVLAAWRDEAKEIAEALAGT